MRRVKEYLKNTLSDLYSYIRKPQYSEKVFCIGFNKTGTTSCGKAFELLGYRNSSFNKKVHRKYNVLQTLNYATKFDSFDDLPWLRQDMIPLLDKTFPDSKFVYLERDEESWKNSYRNWTYKIHGHYPDNLEEKLIEFISHREFVIDYFKGREKDLLILNISEKDAFQKIANFLGKETTLKKMPHLNKT